MWTKMHKVTELNWPIIISKITQVVHVSKMHELSGLVPLVKMVKQAAFLQQDKATSFQLVKITKLAETLNMTESTI